MMLPVTLLTWSGAATPVLLLIVLLVVLRRSAVEASAFGTIAALAVAVLLFGASPQLLSGEVAKGIWSSVSIMLVIFPAIMLYEASLEVGGFEAIRRELTRYVPNQLLQVLALGWGFSSFLQGPSGFGVPVAVVAPLLISLGVRPLYAVVVPLMGQAWGNTFGTLGLAWEALLQQCGPNVDAAAVALWAGIFLWVLNACTGFLICWFYNRWSGLREGWPAVVVISVIHGGGQLILTQFSPTLAAVIPSTVALAAIPLLVRLPRFARRSEASSSMFQPVAAQGSAERSTSGKKGESALGIHQAFLPYYLLVILMLVVLMGPGVAEFLSVWKTGFAFPETATSYGFVNKAQDFYSPLAWLTHSGSFLLVSVLLAGAWYSSKGILSAHGWQVIVASTMKKSIPAALSVGFLLVMSKIMSGSGQIEVLAQGTAVMAGSMYGLLSPAVGMLGAFMSSSNVSSNILFVSFQESMARLTGYSDVLILAAQTAGAAVGTMISPSKVLLGTTTAGIVGQEGEIIRILVVPALFVALIMGVVVLCSL